MNAIARMIKPAPVPMPPAIARTPEHERAEQLLARLRARRKSTIERIDAMLGWSPEKQALGAELAKLNEEIREVRTALAPLRSRHLANARKAFRGPRRDAAKRALEALRVAESAINEIDVMSAELRRLGGAHADLQPAKILAYLVLPLERLARETKEAS